jgi:hypothetical protein
MYQSILPTITSGILGTHLVVVVDRLMISNWCAFSPKPRQY